MSVRKYKIFYSVTFLINGTYFKFNFISEILVEIQKIKAVLFNLIYSLISEKSEQLFYLYLF